MNNSIKRSLITQSIILVIFLAGMFLNYFMLGDVIDREQYGRVKGDINFYVDKYLARWNDIEKGLVSLDSLYSDFASADTYKGVFCVMTPDGDYLFDSASQSEIPFGMRFGTCAANLLEKELESPRDKGWLYYDKPSRTTSYVRYIEPLETVFFYQLDSRKVDAKYIPAFFKLVAFFVLGSILIILISIFILRSSAASIKREAASDRDMETAARIQSAMLPREHRHLMQMDIGAKLIPAQGVGGDFYYYLLNGGKLYFCIGDVSGKGVPASLWMGRAVTLFRSLAQSGLNAAEITSRMNAELCINNDQNIFITAIIGVVNVCDGEMRYCNAGHGRPLYWDGHPDSSPFYMEGQGGLPLGFDAESGYEEYKFEMEANSLFLLCTDGVNEARSRKGEYYGFDRLASCVGKVKGSSASNINDAVLKSIHSFVKGAVQNDDITLLTFRNITLPKTLEITNNVKELRKLSAFTAEIFKECPMDDKTRIRVRSALDEAMTNCVKYAYGESEGTVRLSATIEHYALVLVLKDSGIPFNPLEYKAEESEELKIGGLGIQMMKASFDKIEYSRIDGENILTLTKHF